jgi:DNA-binding response OmpR family regulator
MSPLIIVVEDEIILGDAICTYLEHHGYTTAIARSGEEGIRLAEEGSPDVALVDIRLPGLDGLSALRKLRDTSAGTEVVMMTAHASVASAVEAMKAGAFDYLTKPLDLDEVRVVVDKALSHQRMRRELSYLKAREETGNHTAEIVGESPTIRVLRQQIQRIAALVSTEGDAPTVLIRGETGSGKEMVARAIHYCSSRAKGPFVEINCAAIPSSLLEAELFGYEKGAYTDARAAKPGLFESADGGTLFLDEIGHMETALQVKLLKAIEEKSVRRVGGLRPKTFNARIVAATNRDLICTTASRRSRWISRRSGCGGPTSRCSHGTFWIASRAATACRPSPCLRRRRRRLWRTRGRETSANWPTLWSGPSSSTRGRRSRWSTLGFLPAARRRRSRSVPALCMWIFPSGASGWKRWSANSSWKRSTRQAGTAAEPLNCWTSRKKRSAIEWRNTTSSQMASGGSGRIVVVPCYASVPPVHETDGGMSVVRGGAVRGGRENSGMGKSSPRVRTSARFSGVKPISSSVR